MKEIVYFQAMTYSRMFLWERNRRNIVGQVVGRPRGTENQHRKDSSGLQDSQYLRNGRDKFQLIFIQIQCIYGKTHGMAI